MLPTPETITYLYTEIGTLAAGALGGLALAYYKLKKIIASDQAATQNDSAQINIVTLLREEINRLSEQNVKLARIVNTLQLEVITLRNENSELRSLVLPSHGVQTD
jgi:FtsZ-binding cell division protein ZapB